MKQAGSVAMFEVYFSEATIDDLMRVALKEIFGRGAHIEATKGGNTEITGVLLELSNPRARVSRTETRGKPFSCLGELCWYLGKTDRLDVIEYYIPIYRKFAEGGKLFGAYGPRLFDWNGLTQFSNVAALLRRKPHSRQAVIQLFAASDIAEQHKDVPCTCTLQFLVRDDALHLLVSMRSNDVFWGFPHDVFCFTMLQEVMASTLGIRLGTYKHVVGSLHLYDERRDAANRFLDEGWQQTDLPMPAMPLGDPWPAIRSLVSAEAQIRTKGADEIDVAGLDSYWADLIRLLQVFRYDRDNNVEQVRKIEAEVEATCFRSFIQRRLPSN